MPRVYQFDADLRSFAQPQGLVAQNVARGVKIRTDERGKVGFLREGQDFPTKVELRTMMDKAQAHWRPLLFIAVFTGLRVS
jgi:hypothetical protein